MWELHAVGWSSGPVRVARRFRDRLFGVLTHGPGLVLPARHVHGIGLRHPLLVLAVARDGRVLGHGLLRPLGAWGHRRASAIVELAPWRDPPPPGARLEVRRVDTLAGCPDA